MSEITIKEDGSSLVFNLSCGLETNDLVRILGKGLLQAIDPDDHRSEELIYEVLARYQEPIKEIKVFELGKDL